MEHKEEKRKEFIATASTEGGEVKDATKVLEKLSISEQPSKGVLGTVWSAAGAIAESVQHAVQGTIDAAYHTAERIQHDAETVGTVGGYVAKQVADKASTVYESVVESKTKELDIDSFLSSPTDDIMEASRPKPTPTTKIIAETAGKVAGVVEAAVSNAGSALELAAAKSATAYEAAKETASSAIASVEQTVEAAKKAAGQAAPEVAAKTAAAAEVAKETAASAIASAGQAVEAAKLTAAQVTGSAAATAAQAAETTKQAVTDAFVVAGEAATAAIETAKQAGGEAAAAAGKFELTMDVVAHLQRIADRTGDAILHETARKAHSACAKGVHDAPGVHLVRVTPDQATELVNLAIMTQDHELADFARYCQSVAATTQIGIEPYPGKIQEELAKGRQVLQQQGRVHTGPGYGAAFASVGRAAPAAAAAGAAPGEQPAAAAPAQLQLTMDMVAHIQRIADRTGDPVLHDTARKAHSACAKGVHDAPGVHLTRVTPDQATELVNLAIRTQDHELANFARYCQSVAATTQIGIEPTPGKIVEEINKGRQELAQGGRAHTGPGYGAAFASVSRSSSQQNLSRQGSQQSLSRQGSQQSLQQQQQSLSRQGSQQTLQQNVSRQSSQQNLSRTSSQSSVDQSGQQPQQAQPAQAQPTQPAQPAQPQQPLLLTMDVVAHLQRIADRTGDPVLHETARRAHSACAKNLNDSPGVHLTYVTPDQATELVNLAIRTQDHELANFARYCQSVAATTGVGVEPSPGKILQEIEKGRQELAQQGRAHTGPGYGAAFASVKSAPTSAATSPSITPSITPSISPSITPAPAPAQQQKPPAVAALETNNLSGQPIQ